MSFHREVDTATWLATELIRACWLMSLIDLYFWPLRHGAKFVSGGKNLRKAFC